MSHVTAIKPLASNPNLRTIYVDGRKVATLRAGILETLRIEVDTHWDDSLADNVQRAVKVDRARKNALARLGRRAYGCEELRSKLVLAGYDAEIAAAVVADLQNEGWLDDRTAAAQVIESVTRKRSAGRSLLQARLRQRKFSEDVIATAIDAWEREDKTPHDRAMNLAEDVLKKQSTDSPDRALRRVASTLARRGFDEPTIEDVLTTCAAKLGIDHDA